MGGVVVVVVRNSGRETWYDHAGCLNTLQFALTPLISIFMIYKYIQICLEIMQMHFFYSFTRRQKV